MASEGKSNSSSFAAGTSTANPSGSATTESLPGLDFASAIAPSELLQRLEPSLLEISQAHNLEALSDAALRGLKRLLPFDWTGFYLFDLQLRRIRLIDALGLSEDEKRAAEESAMHRHPGWVIRTGNPWIERGEEGEALPDGRVVHHNDPSVPPHARRVRSRMFYPVIVEGHTVGTLGVSSSQVDFYSAKQLEALRLVSGMVSIAYSRIRAEFQGGQNIARLKLLVDSLPHGVLLEDADRRVLHANQPFCAIFKLPVAPETLIGMDCRAGVRDFMPFFKDPKTFAARIEEITRTQPTHAEDRLELVDGRVLLREYIPIRVEGQSQGCLWKYEDITEKLRREQEAKETQDWLEKERVRAQYSAKMVSLGEMAGGIAHEVNTPLAVIQTVAEQLAETVEEAATENPASLAEPEFREFMRTQTTTLRQTVDRIAKIVRGMRSFARDGQADPVVSVALATVIDDALTLCGESLKLQGIRVEIQGLDATRTVSGRATELVQVFLNLLNNARDALKQAENPDDRWIRIDVRELGLGRQVEIRFQDGGPGIPAEVRERLFQPFFTTKAPGEGTGLGLGISRTIIEAHGGTLNLVPFPVLPTTFLITLPS